MSTGNSQRSRRLARATRRVVESLEARVMLTGTPDPALDFSKVGNDLDQYFSKANTLLGPKLNRAIPIIGDGLDNASPFLGDIASAIRTNLTSAATSVDAVKAGLLAALGDAGLGALPNNTVPDPVMTNTDPSDPDFEKVQFNLTLHKDLYTTSTDALPFNLELPGLGLKMTANLDVKIGYTIDLKFGLDKSLSGQFYVDVSDTGGTPDVSLDVEVTPRGLNTPTPELQANLAFLRLKVMDDPAKPSKLAGSIGVDLFDTGAAANGQLLLSEIASMDLTPKFKTGASAQLNLKFISDFGSGALPSLEGDFNLDWQLGDALLAPGTTTNTFGSTPNISINNVKVSLGDFFDKFINPIAKEIQDVIKPIQPILDVLGARMPVLSDIDGLKKLFDSNMDGKVTLIETIAHFEPGIPVDFLNAVIKFKDIVSALPSLDENAKIDLGGFSLNGPDSTKSLGVDVRGVSDLLGVNLLESKLFDPISGNFDFQIQGQSIETKNFFQGAKDDSFEGGFRFPILQEPVKALQLFLGKDVPLFTLDLPKMDFNFPFEGPEIPIIPPLFVVLRGQFDLSLDLNFGYDTNGLRLFAQSNKPADIFEGFYVSDTANADGTGPDVPEATMSFGIGAFAELNVVIVRVGVGGGIKAGIEFDLHDRGTPDGKLRPSEIIDDIGEGGIFGLFDMKGFLEAGLSAFVKVGFGPFSVETNFDIVSIRLLDFDIPRAVSGLDIQPATLDADGVLHLNTGPRARDRIDGPLPIFPPDPKYYTDTGEVMFVKHAADTPPGIAPDGTESVTVDYLGYSKTYTGVRSIVGDGGAGDDVLIVRPDVYVPVSLTGGDGDDKLIAGAGPATLRGGAGNDEVAAGGAPAALFGDEGDDLVEGGAGNDTMDGGAGTDTMFGNDGNDQMFGGDGIDAMMGGAGNDYLDGGNDGDDIRAESGDDTAYGQGGDDTIRGGGGNNLLFGGIGNDVFTAGSGTDEIHGDDGNDSIASGAGDDTVYAGAGNDTVDAAEGNDSIFGEDDNDSLFGGDGNDSISGGLGADSLFGQAGADSLTGDAGNDVAFGDAGADTIRGGTENDDLHGGTEDDSIYGEAGDDTIYADEGSDYVEGNAGFDSIYGYLGNDTISGGDDADTIYGEDGADSIHGDAGDDSIFAGEGADRAWGDAGNDTISGGGAEDTVSGGDGNDSISGDTGDDELYGDAGADTVHGNDGADRIWGGTENDSLSGDAGADVVRGEVGDDTLFGGSETDLLEGGDGNDFIAGESGADRMYGGAGNDTVHGDTAIGGVDDNAPDTAYGEAGNDQLFGEGGDDLLDGGAGVDTLSGNAGNDVLVAGTGVGDNLLGGDGNDQIVGSDEGANTDPNFLDATYFGDVIDGGAGNDTIQGLGGADNIQGGDGDDSINSGQNSDFVRGGTGNDSIYAGRGSGDSISGDAGNDTVTGSYEGADTISGGDDNDRIFGQGGNDAITGDAGNDYLDGGGGTDTVSGGAGNDELLGGGGNLDSLTGDDGDDTLRGSDDGADLISGGLGRDHAFGNGGNDTIAGGAGDDSLDGGAGDDVISGDAGSDLILGGAGHDVLYGQNPAGTGEDNAVDYIYGDFGTGANEAGSGRDQIFGQGGNDLLYGEGDDDLIDAGGGASNLVNYGSGEGPNPADFVPPGTTPPPTPQPHPGITQGGSTLPTGIDDRGRWVQYASSATGPGLSGSSGLGLEPSVVTDSAGNQYVAWVDSRNGNYEIYLARHTTGGVWQQLGGSASEGGISNTSTSSRRPSLALDAAGNVIVAWTEFVSGGSEIRVARFDAAANGGAGGWVALGSGISGTAADDATLVNTAAGPVVVWLDSSNPAQPSVYAKLFTGGAWSGLGGASFASGTGVSAAALPRDLAAATDGTRVGIAWSNAATGDIQFREYSAGAWGAVETVAATPGQSSAPSIAYLGGIPFVAWQDDSSGYSEINVASRAGAWTPAGTWSNTQGEAVKPRLASAGGAMHLVWSDDTLANRTGTGVALFAKKYVNANFLPEVIGDASSIGLAPGASPDSVALTVDSAGRPVLAWGDSSGGRSQVFVRANPTNFTGTVYSADAATSVQSILDSAVLKAGDAIVINGTVPGFTVSAADAGVTIIGAPGSSISSTVVINANDVTLQRVQAGAINVAAAARFTLRESSASAVVLAAGASDAEISSNSLGSLSITGGAQNPVVEHNTITAGVSLNSGGAVNLTLRDNKITGVTGIDLAAPSSGTITANNVAASGTGINVAAAFTGTINANDVHNASVGVTYAAAALLNGNRIHDNTTGVAASVAGNASALGFVNPTAPNDIFANATGVSLSSARMQNQHVYGNTTGVTGSGTLGGDTLDLANLIESNTTGVSNFTGPIQFNRIASNATGIAASSAQLIHHNLIYRNTAFGIRVSGKSDVRIVNNTLYAVTGDGVHLDTAAANVQLLNNVIWNEGGYDVYVSDDSRPGFFSDFNDLYTTASGKILHWLKDFSDILDVQMDLNLFDLHSIGATAVNPNWGDPRFVNKTTDDYHVFGLSGGQRFSSPTLDAGGAYTDLAIPQTYVNRLTNPSFETGLSGWTASPGATTQSGAPSAFDGSNYFYAGNAATGFIEQTVDLLVAGYSAAQLDSQDLVVVFGGRVRTIDDTGQLVLTFLDGAGQSISSVTVPISNTTDRWELVGDRRQIPTGARKVLFHFDATRLAGASDDTFLDSAFLYVTSENVGPDQGAYGNVTATDQDAGRPHVDIRSPDLYVDWDLTHPHTIRWDSYGNTADSHVRLDLYQDTPDGPALFRTIAADTEDDGEFTWIPQNTTPAIPAGTLGLRLQISYLTDNITLDRSSEGFSIPEAGTDYYVDDASNAGDQFTPSAVGNNRNTGKTPTSPKPLLTTVLREYDLGAADTVHVDTGNYQHFTNVVLSGNTLLNNDEGVTITGPTAASNVARIDPLGFSTGALFDLNDGDFVTLSHLTLGPGADRALWLRNSSVNFTGSYLTTLGAKQEGVRIEADSTGADLTHLDVSGSAREGILALGGIDSITDSRVHDNTLSGISLQNSGPVIVEANDVFNNRDGIVANNSATSLATIGNLNLALSRGNKVHDNAQSGISAGGTTLVAGNSVYNNAVVGVAQSGAGSVVANVVFDNYDGVRGGTVTNNRIYHNPGAGVTTYNGSGPTTGNVIYSNGYGIVANLAPNAASLDGPFISNNLVYANSLGGVQITGGRNGQVYNNTIYQLQGDAIRIDPQQSGNYNLRIRNNILADGGGYALNINLASQGAVNTDYNDFVLLPNGQVGVWSGAGRATLQLWKQASGQDANSLALDPQFVDLDGADNFLGYQNATNDGRDDDFHLKSAAGSFHGGSLAPAIDAATGLPKSVTGAYVNDASTSPLIDRGDPTLPFANEPGPNGSFVNLGAYGNTTQASKSVIPYVTVTLPTGGEIRPAGQALNIQWRSQDTLGTVDLQLWRQGGAAPVLVIASGTANDGDYTWTVPAGLTTASDYFVRVVRPGPVNGDSPFFSITPATHFYYVNDDTVLPGDVTTAPGSDTNVNNTGLDPAHPKASIQAVLDQYDLGPDDVILVDYGVYLPTNNIVITNQDSGVTIKGPDAPSTSAGATYATTVLADAPSAYYRLGEPSGTTATDASGNARTATYTGGVTLAQPGAIPNNADTAAKFDGINGHVALPAGFASFPNGFSFEVWANPTASTNWARFFDLGTGPSNNIVFSRVGASNDLEFAIVNGTTLSGTVVAPGALELNRWQHFAVTMTPAGAVAIYKNGLLVASGNVSVPANVNRTSNYLARSNYATDAYYAGQLDEAAFYDKVLTPAQVKARVASTLTAAVINRGNTAGGSYAFELQNADNVTLTNLSITGGDRGIVAAANSDSDNLTVTHDQIYRNASYGVYIDPTNDNATITANDVHDQAVPGYNGGTGIAINADGALVSANTVHDNQINGIEGGNTGPYTGVAVTIAGNDVYSNKVGINVGYGAQVGGGYTISGNQIHGNSDTDLIVSSTYKNTVASGNTIYGAPTGINIGGAAEAKANTVYNHATGIFTNTGYVTANRVYNNSVRGVYGGYQATVTGNRIYSNAGGIEGEYTPNAAGAGPYYYNNLVYANTQFGIQLRGGRGAIIENNTVYQPTGDAMRLFGSAGLGAYQDRVANNVFVAQSGYAMAVESSTLNALVWDYNDIYVTGTGKFARLDTRDFLTRAAWLAELGLDAHSITADPQFVDPNGADDALGYAGGVDSGADDDFHVKSTSPTIDAGDPNSSFLSEPLPSGARVNQGNYGNTKEATASKSQFVQVLLPNGLERLDAGTQLPINWRSSGLTQDTYIGLLNVGGADTGDWKSIPAAYGVSVPNTGSFGVPVDTSLVTNPAPQSVYTTYTYANNGPGTVLSYAIPVADGNYNLRLHWMEPSSNVPVGGRLFDIKINGVVVQANVDVRALAGTYYKAIALSFPATATAGSGLLIELVSKTVNPAFLCGLEITAPNPAGVPNPTANLDYSTDGGATWTPIATNQPMDLLGRGTFNWTVPNTPSTNVLVRVRANSGSQPSDVSDAPFTINALTHDFYIDPAGDNANSGRSPNAPMASLAAILATYDFGPGEVIHVAPGTYNLINAISIPTQDSGVVIQGPASGAPAVFNRGNTSSPVFVLNGPDDVTLDHLAITGGNYGIYSDGNGGTSDRITLSNLDVYGNTANAVYVYGFNSTGWTITGSKIHDNDQGVDISYTNNLVISNNQVYNHRVRSISVNAYSGTVSGNVVFNNGYGIDLSSRDSTPAATVYATSNTAYANGFGIRVAGNTVADSNTLHDSSASGFGIALAGGIARNNVVYGNTVGIGSGTGQVLNNRVFNNTSAGIATVGDGALIAGNVVFNNPVGIGVVNGYGASTVSGNTVYNNSTAQITVTSGTGTDVHGNTIYAPTGDGIRLDSLAAASITNNIIQVASGIALNVGAGAGSGLITDYNDLYASNTARVARFGNTDFATRAQWFAEFGYDAHSLSVDPKFADPDGPDNILGGVSIGLLASYFNNETFSGAPVLQRVEGQINVPGSGTGPAPGVNADHFSVRWQGYVYIPTDGSWTFSGIADDGQRLYLDNSATPLIDQLNYNGGIEVSATTTLTAGWHAFRYDWVETTGNAYASLRYAGPGTPKQLISGPSFSQVAGAPTLATDDNFHLLPTSPAIDAGNPASPFNLEPAPNGGRINLGADGNTPTATTSAAQLAQILSPNGFEKILAGKSSTITFRLAGIPTANPTATISVSLDNGATWTQIASALPVDATGLGTFNWTPATPTTGNTALIRVVAEQGAGATDVSDNPFLIANAGHDYYVNDASTAGDSLTTAPGDNANSGKSPDKPMASLYALLQQYDLGPGDTIHVDNGTYTSLRDIVMLPDDSGVRIQGPATGAAILDRGSTADGTYLFDFAGADDVTLDHLTMVGGNITVRLYYNADSDRVTISNSEIYNSAYRGIFVGPTNDDPVIANNKIHDISIFAPAGIEFAAVTHGTITGNTINNVTGRGIVVYGGSTATPTLVSGNTVFGTTTGIDTGIARVTQNTTYNNTTGIYLDGGVATALNNLVYGNQNGIATGSFAGGNPVIDGNRIYNNSASGVLARGAAIIRNNRIYSNAVGITGEYQPFAGFSGKILSNLIYANTNQGIYFTSANGARIINNTIYQTVGDAVRLTGSPNTTLRNNILVVQAGSDIYVASDSQSGFSSDYNVLFKGAGAAATTGFWNNATQSLLADWQAATGQDTHSTAADPLFVDPDGADNVLGYRTTGAGYDGGIDDNFYLAKNSPAIDAGDTWSAPRTDADNRPAPVDDPATSPNRGAPDYVPAPTAASSFSATGTSQNFHTNGSYFTLNLPFTFNFYGVPYTSLGVGNTGIVRLGALDAILYDGDNSATKLANYGAPLIAALWDHLGTAGAGNDVFVENNTTDPVKWTKIRWNATNLDNNTNVQFALVLFSDGTLRFDYGPGNTGLSPTVGISAGNGTSWQTVPGYDGAAALTGANSILWSFAAGFRDIGAFEFGGSSADNTPPKVLSTTATGSSPTLNTLSLTFSEPLNATDALTPANYRLRYAGPNGTFGDADDVIIPVTPVYAASGTLLSLKLGAYLKAGLYQLTVYGSGPAGQTLHDLAGNVFDGDANGTPGGDYTTTFTILPPAITNPTGAFDWSAAPQQFRLTFTTNVGQSVNANSLTITGPTGVVPAANFDFAYDPATFTATWTVKGLPRNQLPDGNYRATLPASGVTDLAGNPMSADYALDFFALTGDANHDRSVDFFDLVKLAQNYNTTGKTFTQADFTGDGNVDFNDLVILAQRYNTRLAPPTPASPVAAPTFISISAAPMPSLASVLTAKTIPAPTKPTPEKPVSKPRKVATPKPPVRRATPTPPAHPPVFSSTRIKRKTSDLLA